MKIAVLMTMLAVSLSAEKLHSLQYNGNAVTHKDGKTYKVEREVPAQCLDIPIMNSAIWEGEFSAVEVPDVCKITLVKTVGVIAPMHVADGVETYGELEVLGFIRDMQAPENHYLLVDSRGEEWFDYETIPGAVNLWYKPMKAPEKYPELFEADMKRIGAQKRKDGSYDFSKAAKLLLFCNGPWCGQSPMAIKSLIGLGYPPEKIKWYCGGMHAWKSLSMRTTLTEVE